MKIPNVWITDKQEFRSTKFVGEILSDGEYTQLINAQYCSAGYNYIQIASKSVRINLIIPDFHIKDF
jgi:hypothetical protein